MMDYRDNIQKCQDYIHALEEEQRKILVFQRELPLCLQLVTQTIEAYKQQLSGTSTEECLKGEAQQGRKQEQQLNSECSEQTTNNEGPILEEFIPIKKTSSSADNEHQDDEDELESHKPKIIETVQNNNNNNDKSGKKSDWLRSAQLWNQTPTDPPSASTKEENQPKKVVVTEVKQKGGAFAPFQKDNTGCTKPSPSTPAGSACSTADDAPACSGAGDRSGGGGSVDNNNNNNNNIINNNNNNNNSGVGGKKDDKENGQRKSRRCWSPELHRMFLNALQQLGGSHVATPKQIRELMKVDGLTNDEVKSHLQKYRLHTRRPTPTVHHHNNTNAQTPQFVVVGGIWVPPAEYAAALTTTFGEKATVAASHNGIYTPIATAPQPVATKMALDSQSHRQQKKQRTSHNCSDDDRGSHDHHSAGRVHCNSPATSSSTHTTTTSPVY